MKTSQSTCRGKKISVILYPVRLPIWTTKVYSRLLPLRTPLLRTLRCHLPFGQLRRHSWWAQVGQLLEVQPLAGPPLRRLLHFEAPVEESGRLLIGCYWVLKQGARGHDGVKGKKSQKKIKVRCDCCSCRHFMVSCTCANSVFAMLFYKENKFWCNGGGRYIQRRWSGVVEK